MSRLLLAAGIIPVIFVTVTLCSYQSPAAAAPFDTDFIAAILRAFVKDEAASVFAKGARVQAFGICTQWPLGIADCIEYGP